MPQVVGGKMSQCTAKTAARSATGTNLSLLLPAAGRKIPGARWPETARIVRENRPFAIFEFFRGG
jgi:hypothetical protein